MTNDMAGIKLVFRAPVVGSPLVAYGGEVFHSCQSPRVCHTWTLEKEKEKKGLIAQHSSSCFKLSVILFPHSPVNASTEPGIFFQ